MAFLDLNPHALAMVDDLTRLVRCSDVETNLDDVAGLEGLAGQGMLAPALRPVVEMVGIAEYQMVAIQEMALAIF